MKKYSIILILIAAIFCLGACSDEKTSDKNRGDETIAREYHDTSQDQEEQSEDTAQSNPQTPAEPATPEVSGELGLAGSWVIEDEQSPDSVVLELNTDHTFNYLETVSDDMGLNSIVADGTYELNNNSIVLNYEHVTENYGDQEVNSVYNGLENLTYILDHDTLILINGNGESYTFQRD